jgi:hypothetical protein
MKAAGLTACDHDGEGCVPSEAHRHRCSTPDLVGFEGLWAVPVTIRPRVYAAEWAEATIMVAAILMSRPFTKTVFKDIFLLQPWKDICRLLGRCVGEPKPGGLGSCLEVFLCACQAESALLEGGIETDEVVHRSSREKDERKMFDLAEVGFPTETSRSCLQIGRLVAAVDRATAEAASRQLISAGSR